MLSTDITIRYISICKCIFRQWNFALNDELNVHGFNCRLDYTKNHRK